MDKEGIGINKIESDVGGQSEAEEGADGEDEEEVFYS